MAIIGGGKMKPSELLKNLNEISQDITTTISHATPNSLPHLEQLLDAIEAAAGLIEGLIPKPIEEAPKNEDFEILAFPRNEITSYNMEKHCYTKWSIYWEDDIPLINQPTHYIPLSAIQSLMESGE